MKFDIFLNEIAKQIRYNLPEDLYFITMKSSKSSHYFYVGNENQFNTIENGGNIDECTLIKYRVSDHHAVCARSNADESLLMNYYPSCGYNVEGDDFEIESNDEKLLSEEIAKYFTRNL